MPKKTQKTFRECGNGRLMDNEGQKWRPCTPNDTYRDGETVVVMSPSTFDFVRYIKCR